MITQLMKGVFHSRPPLPKYTSTWDVQKVLDHLNSMGDNEGISLKHLTLKTVMLLALTRPSRSADLSQLDLKGRQYRPDGLTFLPTSLAKQSRQGKTIKEFFFPSFPGNKNICPVKAVQAYESRTSTLRESATRLFLSFIRPHKPVTSSTIARWLKSLLEIAGVDTTIFTAHSVRGASTSKAANMGVTTMDILKAADWSSESVFQKFYYKPDHNAAYGRAVLSTNSSSAKSTP